MPSKPLCSCILPGGLDSLLLVAMPKKLLLTEEVIRPPARGFTFPQGSSNPCVPRSIFSLIWTFQDSSTLLASLLLALSFSHFSHHLPFLLPEASHLAEELVAEEEHMKQKAEKR